MTSLKVIIAFQKSFVLDWAECNRVVILVESSSYELAQVSCIVEMLGVGLMQVSY